MHDDLQDYKIKTKQYTNIDGTEDMGFGLILLFMALLLSLPELSTRFILWIVGVNLFSRLVIWGQKTFKKQITWPRTGYVAYRPGDRRKSLGIQAVCFLIAMTILAGGVFFLKTHKEYEAKIPDVDYVNGLVRTFILIVLVLIDALWVFRMDPGHPWKWLRFLIMPIGTLTLALQIPGDFTHLAQPLLMFIGLVQILSGVSILFSFLRRYPQPYVEGAE
jgi:hypothetical protein